MEHLYVITKDPGINGSTFRIFKSLTINNQMKRAFLLIALIFFCSANANAQSMADSLRVIFADSVYLRTPQTSYYSKRFTPTVADINTADSILVNFLQQDPHGSLTASSFPGYYRQYAGNMRGGQNFIYVIGTCNKPSWFREQIGLYFIKGGGSCYFNTIISLLTGKIIEFHINAPK
jgi:hypothetical protein